MNLSVEKLCNIGGCVLILVLIILLLFKPSSIMSLLESTPRMVEGQRDGGPKNNDSTNNGHSTLKNAKVVK